MSIFTKMEMLDGFSQNFQISCFRDYGQIAFWFKPYYLYKQKTDRNFQTCLGIARPWLEWPVVYCKFKKYPTTFMRSLHIQSTSPSCLIILSQQVKHDRTSPTISISPFIRRYKGQPTVYKSRFRVFNQRRKGVWSLINWKTIWQSNQTSSDLIRHKHR